MSFDLETVKASLAPEKALGSPDCLQFICLETNDCGVAPVHVNLGAVRSQLRSLRLTSPGVDLPKDWNSHWALNASFVFEIWRHSVAQDGFALRVLHLSLSLHTEKPSCCHAHLRVPHLSWHGTEQSFNMASMESRDAKKEGLRGCQ